MTRGSYGTNALQTNSRRTVAASRNATPDNNRHKAAWGQDAINRPFREGEIMNKKISLSGKELLNPISKIIAAAPKQKNGTQ